MRPAAGHGSRRTGTAQRHFLVADDLGYGDLSCYGAQGVSTPHTDSLAREGVRFTDAHAVASTSTPSRYSLLTGQYAFRRDGTDIAAGNAGMIIRPEQYTLADLFRSQGYRTYAVGNGTWDWAAAPDSRTGTARSTRTCATWALTATTSWRLRPTVRHVSTLRTGMWPTTTPRPPFT